MNTEQQNNSMQSAPIPNSSEAFRKIPNDAESFRSFPHASETFGNIPQPSAPFGSFSSRAEKTDQHTLTVREVARMFEAANVARSERSITNWCQPNRQGVARLDAYFDPNERRYFITALSVEAVIAEEKSKAMKSNVSSPIQENIEETEHPQPADEQRGEERDSKEVSELENEVRDLKILNKAKEMYIERLEQERNGMLTQLVEGNRTIGRLETELRLIGEPPGNGEPRKIQVRSIRPDGTNIQSAEEQIEIK